MDRQMTQRLKETCDIFVSDLILVLSRALNCLETFILFQHLLSENGQDYDQQTRKPN